MGPGKNGEKYDNAAEKLSAGIFNSDGKVRNDFITIYRLQLRLFDLGKCCQRIMRAHAAQEKHRSCERRFKLVAIIFHCTQNASTDQYIHES